MNLTNDEIDRLIDETETGDLGWAAREVANERGAAPFDIIIPVLRRAFERLDAEIRPVLGLRAIDNLRPIDEAEALRYRIRVLTAATISPKGVVRWNSNGSTAIPQDMEEAGIVVTEAHRAARDEEVGEFIAAYRAQQSEVSDEERAEMRAAFGSGRTVVNVITGRKTRI